MPVPVSPARQHYPSTSSMYCSKPSRARSYQPRSGKRTGNDKLEQVVCSQRRPALARTVGLDELGPFIHVGRCDGDKAAAVVGGVERSGNGVVFYRTLVISLSLMLKAV